MEKAKQRPSKDDKTPKPESEEYEEDDGGECVKRDPVAGRKGSGSATRGCQAEKCPADLTDARPYHRRHRVCELHAKAPVVVVGGMRQRFCQQCSRFHELSEFDDTKRSCRRRLAGHNERRRKSSGEPCAKTSGRKGSGSQLKEMACGQVDDRGRIQIGIQENATYKHFQIR
ncbi:squamosa promoter-binding protein 1-like isoform X2 [Punica granatum]|uniref:SBP-type domain-containing protein n=2 Tax=Punica granatum TaxID=22663 RepID=A0A218Y1X4_PUNGR|nr:squamosa promoter-binding protein 1-like isoform X2 [Punica granatum]OWM91058.1 hypothetical protein CDL15_Pgr023391 [Punica granatum]PKI51324.1 hypothetical protein CRG98_028271 [Punica granatum]